jgi:hypothetical protein
MWLMADTIHSIVLAYPALTGFILAMVALVIVLRAMRWMEDRKPRPNIHSGPDDVETRSRRAF